MIINPKIKETLKEIARQSVSYGNYPDKDRKYLRKLLRVMKEQLTEEEQIYVLKSLLESLHYKNIVTDPDNVLQIHNLRLRSIMMVTLMVGLLMLLAAGLFNTNSAIDSILTIFGNMFKIISM